MMGKEGKVGVGRVFEECDSKEEAQGRDKGWGGGEGAFGGDVFVFKKRGGCVMLMKD